MTTGDYEYGLRDVYLELKDFHGNVRYVLEEIERRVFNIERVLRKIEEREEVRQEFAYDELE